MLEQPKNVNANTWVSPRAVAKSSDDQKKFGLFFRAKLFFWYSPYSLLRSKDRPPLLRRTFASTTSKDALQDQLSRQPIHGWCRCVTTSPTPIFGIAVQHQSVGVSTKYGCEQRTIQRMRPGPIAFFFALPSKCATNLADVCGHAARAEKR
ncbi:hypothetical protein [Bradyrhizobium sp. BR 1432]|uniref:hypothetical protein n=1 Tax=Bradyrhizobium sp. BR 1432 TaxID=3447966 RepID=UPI003EE5E3D0